MCNTIFALLGKKRINVMLTVKKVYLYAIIYEWKLFQGEYNVILEFVSLDI